MNSTLRYSLCPSRNNSEYWAEVRAQNLDTYEYTGSWQVSVSAKEHDEMWKKIVDLTLIGKLGPSSMTPTAKNIQFTHNTKNDSKEIFIFTKDCNDIEDVSRVAWVLYENNIFKKELLKYKANKPSLVCVDMKKGDKTSLYSIGIKAIASIASQEQLATYFKSKLVLKKPTTAIFKELTPPSKDKLNLWQTVKCNKSNVDCDSNFGKWKMHVPLSQLDETWKKVADLTQKRHLGPLSKVETIRLASNHKGAKTTNSIIVYTKDCNNMEDIARVALTLHKQNIFVGSSIEYKGGSHSFSLSSTTLKSKDTVEKLANFLNPNIG